ncbi:unnamed protein product [Rangifer tarandus platyrhynchus]|uniref:Uncharacterized protein n=3 Tax=Rangifer tarandus platyrhynchus TaxID=3082113 RepID=A0ACB0E5X2_RANTA|nr:unnamed protein product [Rangifer tarandus platyrhynchus]CAI9696000.1 unnamed protein product [Rangifer tarandus platyrhynchus]
MPGAPASDSYTKQITDLHLRLTGSLGGGLHSSAALLGMLLAAALYGGCGMAPAFARSPCSVWVLGCSEGLVLPYASGTRVDAMLFPRHERQKIRLEGSRLGGLTYNLGDVRDGSHIRSWWEDSLGGFTA